MNQHLYTELVLKPHFIPFYYRIVEKYGNDVQIQEDGGTWHFAPVPAAYKALHYVQCLQWPAQSPDLSPIENLWHQAKVQVSSRRHRIKNITEMAIAVVEEWAKVDLAYLQSLTNSMLKRLKQCIQAKGGSTKY